MTAAAIEAPVHRQTPVAIPSLKAKRDTQRDTKGTLKTKKKGLSLSQCIIRELEAEPNRPFVIRDIVDRTGGSYESVKRTLLRLSSTGKGSGSVSNPKPGIYQYDPEKENNSLQVLIRSNKWKFENIRFTKSVPIRARVGGVSLSEPVPEPAKGTPSNLTQSVPHPNVPYPWTAPTGHLVTWEDYPTTGTQVISISANGSPPLSPDAVLLMISKLIESGLDDSWNCTSIESSIDSRYHRIDGSYSMQLIEGVLIKMYQHGYTARIEIADRRTILHREIMNLFHSLANTFDGQGIIREQKRYKEHMDERMTRCERGVSFAIRETTKAKDKPVVKPSRKKPTTTGFTTALELRKQEGGKKCVKSANIPKE